ncbi:hypothetical protein DPMN_006866 [Dreissena polymorpha]|uniref:Uncharacterized protein n=1 Tax=Dreissena polymorpha TaxID=45954 RepID=A0A9D4MW74_DREPO|nr:hypothetical protein DPMN_006866 [Dreissena polymorpha]
MFSSELNAAADNMGMRTFWRKFPLKQKKSKATINEIEGDRITLRNPNDITERVTGDPKCVQFSVVHQGYTRATRLYAAARTPHETTEASTAVRVLVNTRVQTPGYRCRHCGLIVIFSDIHAYCQRLSALHYYESASSSPILIHMIK